MIGIIGAMEQEVSQVVAAMTNVSVSEIAGMKFNKGKFCNKDVIVVKSGIGKVNAAICAEILVACFNVDKIINTGIAGSLKNEINIGDVVLSTDALQHDVDATNFGYAKGVIPGMAVSTFIADEGLIKTAEEACHKACPDIEVFKGRVVSGDIFVSDKAVKNSIAETFHGYCTEMEGAAIAQAAYLNKVPFLIIRAISDKADDSASMDYNEFEKKAIANSVKLLTAMMEEI
jgi:adenosylhomocysteine nucleosidase